MQGNFRVPKKAEEMPAWQELMRKSVIGGHSFDRVHLMRPNFTTQCLSVVSDGWNELMPSVFQSSELSDGLVTSQSNVALGMTNGDCPAAIVYDEDEHRLALLHCGLKCLVQPDSGIGIFEVFFKRHEFNRKTVKVRIGYGIDSCCYGLDWLPDVHRNTLVKKLPTSGATKGPETGKVSIDLFALMRSQLLALGLQSHQIIRETKPPCTACAEINGELAYHSNLYDRASSGRNLVLAWMQPRA
jgi:copper oxidase (laccase) domain-containing protein